MGFKRRSAFVLGMVLFCMTSWTLARTPEHEVRGVTLVVYDDVHPPTSTLAQAKRQFSAILREAGIGTTWVYCSEHSQARDGRCDRAFGDNTFAVHIIPHGVGESDRASGVAFLDVDGRGTYCDALFDRIDQAAGIAGVSVGGLLGTVIAHEIGHLLLGLNAHSPTGIMKPHWGREDLNRSMGWLLFEHDQALRMRTRVQSQLAHPQGEGEQTPLSVELDVSAESTKGTWALLRRGLRGDIRRRTHSTGRPVLAGNHSSSRP